MLKIEVQDLISDRDIMSKTLTILKFFVESQKDEMDEELIDLGGDRYGQGLLMILELLAGLVYDLSNSKETVATVVARGMGHIIERDAGKC